MQSHAVYIPQQIPEKPQAGKRRTLQARFYLEPPAMIKEKQIGIRVGVPAFFCLELEDVYKRGEGAHQALAFPDFVGLLVGMGLEQYGRQYAPVMPEPETEGGPEAGGEGWDFPEKIRRGNIT
jgi:hypothetical protein